MNTHIASRRVLNCCLLPLVVLLGACAGETYRPMSLMLDGAHEVPAVMTTASGSGEVMVGADHSVSGSIKVAGMSPTMAHIHLGAAGKNGPVIVPLTKTSESSFAVPDGSKLNDSQYESYLAGNLYINVHSAAHPGGEIRVQLMPAMGGQAKW